jgi:hypothetical protein
VSTVPIARSDLDLPLVVTHLMKGVVYADSNLKVWRHLLQLQPQVRDHVAVMGLTVTVDEAEGYAFLRQRPDDDTGDGSDETAVPKLVPRRALTFHVSLLLALLRKRLAEFDASDSGTVCVLTREQIVAMVEVFLPTNSNEARMVDQIDAHITKVAELGFLRKVRDAENSYEIRRILKAFVDAQWLAGFDEGLRRYAVQVGALPADDDAAVGRAESPGDGPHPEENR